MTCVFQRILAILIFLNRPLAHPKMVITVVMIGKNLDSKYFEMARSMTQNFSARFKEIEPADAQCATFDRLGRIYAPVHGQTMIVVDLESVTRPICDGKYEGNIFFVRSNAATTSNQQLYRYGVLDEDPQNDLSNDLQHLISFILAKTEITSDINKYYDLPQTTTEKKKSGVPIPGYVVLILSLATVLCLAVMARVCAAYQKEKPSKSVFDKSPVAKKSNQKQQQKKPEKASNEKPRKVVKSEESSDKSDEEPSKHSKNIRKNQSAKLFGLSAFITPNRRRSEEVLDDPVTSQDFLLYLRQLSKIAIEYHNDPAAFNVTTDFSPGFLYRTMPRFAPENAEPFDLICNDLRKKILPGMTHWQHPRFYAYFLTGRRFPDMLAEVITSAMAFNIYSWESCPSLHELEYAVVNWIGRAFGLPEAFLFQEDPQNSPGGGSIYGSASDAIFCSVLVARNWKINQIKEKQEKEGKEKREQETIYDIGKKLVVYCSKDAHSGIEKACKVAMVRCRSIQTLQSNNWGITGPQLEKHIIKDLEHGLIPTLFHCTLGTAATAADDDLVSIYPIAQKYDMWIHCDASYSGNAWIDTKYRGNATALVHAHSVNVNLHKSLLFSHMSCLLWTKHRKTYKDAFKSHVFQMRPLQDYSDVRDWGIHTSRRNKALKIWMSLRLNGLNGLRHHLNNAVEMCQYFESLLVTHPLLKVHSRKLTLLTFYYEEPGCTSEERNLYTENLCQFINTSHKLYFTHTKVHDLELIRMSICYERTNKSVIDESWRILKSLVDEFTNRKNDPYLLHTKMVAPTRRRKLQKPESVDYAELSAYTRPKPSKPTDKQ